MEEKDKEQRTTQLYERIAAYIEEYFVEHGYAPSYAEIGKGTGFASQSSVNRHIQRMINLGYLETDATIGAPRALRVPGYVPYKETNYMIKGTKLVAVIFLCILLTGCNGMSGVYENTKTGYISVQSVHGVTFDITKKALEAATAITNMNADVEFDTDQTYVYKNNTDEWYLFNIGVVVLTVEKGTKFHLQDAKEKEDALSNSNVNDVWMTKDGDKLKSVTSNKSGIYKEIMTVDAQVSITPQLYNDFTGKLAVINDGNEEWSLFVGIAGTEYKDLNSEQKEFVDHIAKSFRFTGDDAETTSEEIPVAQVATVETKDSQTESEEEGQGVHAESSDPAGKLPEESKNVAKIEPTYFALGETATFTTLNLTSSEMLQGEITIDTIYTGDEAKNIIKTFCDSKNTPYFYQDPPDGCSWHVAKYSINIPLTSSYVNIRLTGADSQGLKFRGIQYSRRTHDIFSQVKSKDEIISDLYCYYAVPNGCETYFLMVGDALIEPALQPLYQIISKDWK